jgi:hypothetical protein
MTHKLKSPLLRGAAQGLPAALGLVLALSCSARINGVLRNGGTAALSVHAALLPRTAALIRSLQALTGKEGGESPLLDGPALAHSLGAAPGISSASFTNPDPAAVEGTIALSRVGELLSFPGERGRRFAVFEERDGGGSLRIRVDLVSAPALLSLISPEAVGYLEALMAPAVTGEQISQPEYLLLLAAIYGRPLAEEIAAARIRLSLELPRPVTAIRGGRAEGNRAEFELPLLDLLVLESPLIYEVAWN